MWRRGDRRYAERVMRNPRGKRTAGGSSKTHASRPPQLRRVLIADDNLAEREMYASYFAAHGIRVFMAGGGGEPPPNPPKKRAGGVLLGPSPPPPFGWEGARPPEPHPRPPPLPNLPASG